MLDQPCLSCPSDPDLPPALHFSSLVLLSSFKLTDMLRTGCAKTRKKNMRTFELHLLLNEMIS